MLARAIADEAEAAAAGDGGEPHACYVISHSIAKRQNLGTLARSCTAFNVKEVRAASPATRPPVTWAAPSSLRAHCGCVRRCWWSGLVRSTPSVRSTPLRIESLGVSHAMPAGGLAVYEDSSAGWAVGETSAVARDETQCPAAS